MQGTDSQEKRRQHKYISRDRKVESKQRMEQEKIEKIFFFSISWQEKTRGRGYP